MGTLRKAISLTNEFVVPSVQLNPQTTQTSQTTKTSHLASSSVKPSIYTHPHVVTHRLTEANGVIMIFLPRESVLLATSHLKQYFLIKQTWTYHKVIYNNVLNFKESTTIQCTSVPIVNSSWNLRGVLEPMKAKR